MVQVDELRLEGQAIRLARSELRDFVADEVADGRFERPMPQVFLAAARTFGGVIFDIGANNGVYSILCCRAVPSVRSYAFEPYAPVLDVLVRNRALNGLDDRIQVHPVALSDRTGAAELFVPDDGHGMVETSCSLDSTFKPFARSTSVRCVRLDDLALPHPSIIKLDVEGHEPAVLLGACDTIRTARPIIFIEVLRAADPRLANRLCRELGLRRYRLRHDGVVIRERSIEFDLAAWNHVMVPEERVRRFEAAVVEAGVQLS